MKNMRKLASLLLALVMVFAMATTAFADGEETGTISINGAINGHTYSAWQILVVQSYTTKDGAIDNISYTVADDWKDASQEAWFTKFLTVDDNGYVTLAVGVESTNDSAAAAEFAKAAVAYAEENNITATGTDEAEDNTATISGLADGYYVVDTTLGSLCSLDTLAGTTVEIREKNEVPTVEKKVQEDSDPVSWGKMNDAEIGQTVYYKTVITVHPGTTVLELHDVMSAGLTLNTDVAIEGLTATDYTVNYNPNCTHDAGTCDFMITFTSTYLEKITAETDITVTYSAVVNENAQVAVAMPNETAVKYDNDSWTNWDKTNTYTWDLKVYKYTNGENDSPVALAGAKFSLSTSNTEDWTPLNFVDVTVDSGVPTYELCKSTECEHDHVTVIETNGNGAFFLQGLDSDTYYLHEVKAPDGYNALTAPVKVVIDAGTPTESGISYTSGTTNSEDVLNQSGSELPSTGGMGTTLFYIVGGILVVAAVVLLVTKKRMTVAE